MTIVVSPNLPDPFSGFEKQLWKQQVDSSVSLSVNLNLKTKLSPSELSPSSTSECSLEQVAPQDSYLNALIDQPSRQRCFVALWKGGRQCPPLQHMSN